MSISYEGHILEQVKTQKFLAVWLQEDLCWNEHIVKLTADLSRNIGCLYKLNSLIPLWLKNTL